MDLQVVEVRIAHTWGRPDGILRPAPEWRAFRDANVYAPVDGEVEYAPVTLEEHELAANPVDDLALLNGRIADAVAEGGSAGKNVMMVGGNCTCVPGVIGGLQQGLGPTVRIGLVWVDAHGDFNTPQTSTDGLLGGMPVAVVAGLCHPTWRAGAHIQAPIPTDRIVMADVRKLYPREEQLIRASDVTVVSIEDPKLPATVDRLARETDLLYVHVDLDVLDASLIPAHMAGEPDGPDIRQTVAGLESILDTGAVNAFALVSLYATRPGGEKSVAAATEILRPCIRRWVEASAP